MGIGFRASGSRARGLGFKVWLGIVTSLIPSYFLKVLVEFPK